MKIEYTKLFPDETKASRKFFKKHVHDKFVKFVARRGLLNYIVSKDELERAKEEGKLPSYLAVHHIRPLSGTLEGANRFDNLVVMHDVTHRELHHNVYDPQLAWVERGLHYQTRELVVPDFEKYVDIGGILKEYQREMMEYVKQNKRGR